MQRDPTPGHAFHVRHLSTLIDTGCVMHLLFQNCENPGWRSMTWSPRANTRSRDANTITIHIGHLLSNAGYDQQRSFRGALWFPHVFTWLQRHRFRRHTYALGKNLSKNERSLENEQAGGKDNE